MPLLLLALLGACDRNAQKNPSDDAPTAALRGAGLHRLTDAQWRASVTSLTGVEYTGELPADYVLYNYASVGAAEATVAPYELEQYESAAWAVAERALPDSDALRQTLGCWPQGELGREDLLADATALCVAPWLADLAARAWRRPLQRAELDALIDLYEGVSSSGDQPLLAARAAMASVLLSPRFLFRAEAGSPAEGGRRPYTDHELAARLAFFITDSLPDSALLADADAGRLTGDPDALREHAQRLLQTPEARDTFIRFFGEWMDLARLEVADKDRALYPWFDDAARASMATELGLLFEEVAFTEDQPLGTLLTTDIAYVDETLAALYGVSWPGNGHERVRLPAEDGRGGILGRAGLLALNAHATVNSPTRRGKFVRARLLCQDIPPPPEGVIASLDELVTEGSLRDRLDQHANDPACSGCHNLMDPIGYSLEYFGPAGELRADDNGYAIDASATLDGTHIEGAADLGEAIAAHPNLAYCLTTQVWRDAVGAVEESDDTPALDAIADGLPEPRFQEIVLAVVDSEAFRYALVDEDPDAPALHEVCSGEDDDGDGEIDESLVAACEAPWGPGLQECGRGEWLTCVGPPRSYEACDGADNDDDGVVDESVSIDVTEKSYATLTATHGGCVPTENPFSDFCYSATHRQCAASACGHATGFGPVTLDDSLGAAAVTCLSADEGVVVSTTYTELSGRHSGCTTSDPYGPSCNASINRTCNALGYTTGYGPVEHSGDTAIIVCTPGATIYNTTYTALSAHNDLCDGETERMGAECFEAMHRFCRAEGFASGHGPLENSGDTAYVACVGAREDLR